MPTLITLTSLLLSTTLLLVGHGMHLTLLPLRASAIGHGDTLVVELSDQAGPAGSYVVADAVRVERVGELAAVKF